MWPTVGGALASGGANMESWKQFAPSFVVAQLGEPIFYLLAIGYGLGRFVDDDRRRSPYAALPRARHPRVGGDERGELREHVRLVHPHDQQKTYDAILATPIGIREIVAGDILWAASQETLSACARAA